MFSTVVNNFIPVLNGRRVSKERSHPSTTGGYQIMYLESTRIRYSVSGSGSTCIVISADPPAPLEAYGDLIEKLSEKYTVVAFEAPGFGFSHPLRLNSKHDFESVTNYVLEFIVNLDRGPYVLALPCMLGYSAIKIAHTHAALVSHVVLNQTPSWPEAVKWRAGRDRMNILRTPVLGQLALILLGRRRVRKWFADVISSPSTASGLTTAAQKSLDSGACFSLASCFQTYMRKNPELKKINQPCLIVWGNDDVSHSKTKKCSTRTFTNDYSECVLQGVGHSPELEDTSRFVTELDNFLVDRTCQEYSEEQAVTIPRTS